MATARLFACEGAKVFIAGRRDAELKAAIEAVGFNARGVQADISRLADLDNLFNVVKREAGKIDVLFANAGGGSFLPLTDITEKHYADVFDTNVKGTIFTVQKALPLLKDGSAVILTGSTAATQGIPGFSAYGASKAAIRNLARNWIRELAPRSIRVNVLVPGATSTPGWHALTTTEEQNRQMQEMSKAAAPSGRMAHPDEIAHAALFLATDDSSYVNGSELFVDGGSAQI